MGNPHAVCIVDDVASRAAGRGRPDVGVARRLPAADQRPLRAGALPGEVTMRTWERGSGITLACGTGRVRRLRRRRAHRPHRSQVLAHLPGGDLELEWSESTTTST